MSNFLVSSKCRYSFSFSLKKTLQEQLKLELTLFGIDSFRYVEHYFTAEITEINPLINQKLITSTLFVFLWQSGMA